MTANPETLEETASAYEEAAAKLREAATILRTGPVKLAERNGQATEKSPQPHSTVKLTRLEQLRQWLKIHGPATRSEAVEGSGLPENTVRVLLVRKNFDRDEEARWRPKSEGK